MSKTDSPSATVGVSREFIISVDLGTAYSKCAYQAQPGFPIPIAVTGSEFLLASDLALEGDHIVPAKFRTGTVVMRDVKTQLRNYPLGACVSLTDEPQSISTFDAVVFLYRVLLRRALEEIHSVPVLIRATVPSLAFVGREDLQYLYREAIARAYNLAGNSQIPWNEPLSLRAVREANVPERLPKIELISEPTAALSDRIHEVPEQVFAVIDIGAGTTDIAIMARSTHDFILAEDTVPSGGRLLKEIADELARTELGVAGLSEGDFQVLLGTGTVSVGSRQLTADAVLSHEKAVEWISLVNSCLMSVKVAAQKGNFMPAADFVHWVSQNIYVAGGIGRSEAVRRRILQGRSDAPRGVPIPTACQDWATAVGSEAQGLFLQLAPAVGAQNASVQPTGKAPAPMVQSRRTLRPFDSEDVPG